MERNHHTATELLGLTRSPGDRDVIAAATAAATDARALVIALGVVLGDIEESTSTHTWRNPSDTIRRYLAFLADNGYTLSDIEKTAAGITTTATDATATDTPPDDTSDPEQP
jgi:ParB family chromosome partitioning protein